MATRAEPSVKVTTGAGFAASRHPEVEQVPLT
jgi:hypothetical protein